MNQPQVLQPYRLIERLTMRDWCLNHDLGRKVRGRWYVSKVALAMFLDGDRAAVAAYLAGDRSSALVTSYFARLGVPLPKPHFDGQETTLSEVERL
jgi:hypothetical protein